MLINDFSRSLLSFDVFCFLSFCRYILLSFFSFSSFPLSRSSRTVLFFQKSDRKSSKKTATASNAPKPPAPPLLPGLRATLLESPRPSPATCDEKAKNLFELGRLQENTPWSLCFSHFFRTVDGKTRRLFLVKTGC